MNTINVKFLIINDMDWYVIDYLYPKAFIRFSKIMFPNTGIPSLNTLEFFDNKKLYYFFDGEGIYFIPEIYNSNKWGYIISLQNGFVLSQMSPLKSNREECEIEGFYECFKLLDKILT